jgi:hypothetical protein
MLSGGHDALGIGQVIPEVPRFCGGRGAGHRSAQPRRPGVDLILEYVELTAQTGVTDRVSYQLADATDLRSQPAASSARSYCTSG